MGTFTYGLYLGNDDSRMAHGTGFMTQSNGLDLFLGGDMGVKWGARVHYANAKDETTAVARKHNAFGLGLGAEMGDAEAYANIDLADKSSGKTAGLAGDESKQKPSFTVGGSYKFAGWSFFAEYEANKLEEKVTTTTTTSKDTQILVGTGRVHEINPTARLITDLTLSMASTDAGAGKTKTNKLPATLGMEVDATSWLVLRGSVAQNIILGEEKNPAGKKKTLANSTSVNAGATLNFGKLKVDGMIGNTGNSRAGTVGSNQGALTTDNLLTRVAVS